MIEIKQARLRAGFTQAELALRVGLTRSTIASIEQGRSKPSYDSWQKICKVLGIGMTTEHSASSVKSPYAVFRESLEASPIPIDPGLLELLQSETLLEVLQIEFRTIETLLTLKLTKQQWLMLLIILKYSK